VTKRNAINILLEAAIAHTVSMTRESLRAETLRINDPEINQAVLTALARVVAKELMLDEVVGNPDPVTKVPNGSGTHFLVSLQEELQRLHGLKKGQQ